MHFCRRGVEVLYYYLGDGVFLLSDDMWDIVKTLQPQYEDLNIDNIKKMMAVGYTTMDGETFIKGLRILRYGHVVRYDADMHSIEDRPFIDFRRESKITDLDEAVEAIDQAMNQAMKTIKSLCGKCTYGVGISGGLDSRIIPFYALNNGMDIVGFNNCVPRPKSFLLSRSCKNARQIASIYGIPYTEVKWTPAELEKKKRLKLEKYPMGPQDSGSDICKYETDGFPDFDVLLTGGSGAVIGSTLHSDIEEMSDGDIANYMIGLFCRNVGNSVTASRVSRALEYIFGMKAKKGRAGDSILDFLVGEEVKESVFREIREYVHTMKESGASSFDVIYNYVVNIVSYQNRYGAYESRFGNKRSFSIYVPFLLPTCRMLSPELLEDRVVLEELIRAKIPQVASVKSESFQDSPKENRHHKFERIRRIFNVASFLLRGNGSFVNQYYYKKPELQKSFMQDMQNGTSWFYRIFSIEDHVKEFAKQDVKTFFSVWDMKQMLDCFEKKTYLEF